MLCGNRMEKVLNHSLLQGFSIKEIFTDSKTTARCGSILRLAVGVDYG